MIKDDDHLVAYKRPKSLKKTLLIRLIHRRQEQYVLSDLDIHTLHQLLPLFVWKALCIKLLYISICLYLCMHLFGSLNY
jgi:hypothetical protein